MKRQAIRDDAIDPRLNLDPLSLRLWLTPSHGTGSVVGNVAGCEAGCDVGFAERTTT